MSWKSTVQNNYGSFDSLVSHDDLYGIVTRLGFRDARHLWDANPRITGSVYPRDLKVVIPRNEIIEGHRVRCYDNGGKTCDRYSVLYMDAKEHNGLITCRAMSARPTHPQGFGQMTIAMPGAHLGKRVLFALLPGECQTVVRRDLT